MTQSLPASDYRLSGQRPQHQCQQQPIKTTHHGRTGKRKWHFTWHECMHWLKTTKELSTAATVYRIPLLVGKLIGYFIENPVSG
jgi:hypothetical protein